MEGVICIWFQPTSVLNAMPLVEERLKLGRNSSIKYGNIHNNDVISKNEISHVLIKWIG